MTMERLLEELALAASRGNTSKVAELKATLLGTKTMFDHFNKPLLTGDAVLLISSNGSKPEKGVITRFGKNDVYVVAEGCTKERRKSPDYLVRIASL